jgi:tetratricopeptide (TPR) repeat protein
MIERDYFMRMINILTQMIARILFLKNKKEFPTALLDIQTTGKTLLGIDGDMARRLSPAQIMQLFGSDLTVAVPKSYVAAILFKEEADLRALMGKEEESAQLYVRALTLLLDVLEWANEPVEPNHVQVTEEVIEKLKGYSLPVDLLDKLVGFHERMGQYDKAENLLYDILEIKPDYAAEGLLFYERLLEKKDEDLKRGGLPREEIMEGMEELKKAGNRG